MAYSYDSEEIYRADKQLAEYIGNSLGIEIEKTYNAYTHSRRDYEVPISVHVFKLREDHRGNVVDGYGEYDLCHLCCEEIRLIDNCCSFETLIEAVRDVSLKDFFYAKLRVDCSKDDEFEEHLHYLFFKNPSKLNFGKTYCSDGSTLIYTNSEDFEKKYKNRNLDIKLEEYKQLISYRNEHKESYERYVKKIEDFKKGLTEEELLAISVVDQ